MLREKIKQDLKPAMKAGDSARVRTIRSLMSALMEEEIRLREQGKAEISDDLAVDVIMKAAKQRRDSQSQYAAAGREDLAEKEAEELAILEEYLPAQLSDEEIRSGVEEITKELGATSMKDMGRVMGLLQPKLKGRTDMGQVSQLVKSRLG